MGKGGRLAAPNLRSLHAAILSIAVRRSLGLLLGACACAHMTPDAGGCPTGPMVEGIDVSVYQGAIDWPKVAAAGVEFAYIRVGDGLRPVDARFHENWDGAR